MILCLQIQENSLQKIIMKKSTIHFDRWISNIYILYALPLACLQKLAGEKIRELYGGGYQKEKDGELEIIR